MGRPVYDQPVRPDLQGLRAVAISLVVLAHGDVPWLAGGFVGVDVFFVLSGYLISGLLLKEVGTTGRIDLPRFYARRFKRLLPALVVMVGTTTVAAAALLSPFEALRLLASAPYASTGQATFILRQRRSTTSTNCPPGIFSCTLGRLAWRNSSTWPGRSLS